MNSTETVRSVPLKQYLYNKAAVQGIPISANFELSPICNFNCRMCYVHQTPEQVRNHDRPMLTVEEWICLAEQMKKQGTLYILLTGGEPFLWPDFWKLYETLYQMGFVLSVNTNGSLITSDVVARLKRMPPAVINITLYGSSDDTYEQLCGQSHIYQRVIDAIMCLRENDITARVNGSVTPDNAGDLEHMIQFAGEHHLPYRATAYMFPAVRTASDQFGRNHRFSPEDAARYRLKIERLRLGEEQYPAFLRRIMSGSSEPMGLDDDCEDLQDGSMRCLAGKASVWTTWDGYLALCGMIPDFRVDLRKTSFASAWQEMKQIASSLQLSGVCAKCPDIGLCHSCAAMAYAETGHADGIPVYMCRMVKEIRRLAELELQLVNSL